MPRFDASGGGIDWNNPITRRRFLKRTGAATAGTMLALHGMKIEVMASDPNSNSSWHAYELYTVLLVDGYVDPKNDGSCCDGSGIAQFVNDTLALYPVNDSHGGAHIGSGGGGFTYNPITEKPEKHTGTCTHDQPVKTAGGIITSGPHAGKYKMQIKVTSTAFYHKVPL